MGWMEGGAWWAAKTVGNWIAPELGMAIAGTKLLKGAVDEDTRKRLQEVREAEACPHVKACSDYGTGDVRILAQVAAKDSKTAWEASNLLWVYHDQIDFAPKHARQVYHMRPDGTWEAQGGGWGKPITGGPCKQCVAVRGGK